MFTPWRRDLGSGITSTEEIGAIGREIESRQSKPTFGIPLIL
jgi:hypothetical protein